MTQAAKPTPPEALPLPGLSDDAAAEIYLFIEHILNLFEARYGAQISRFYESMSRDNLIDSDHDQELDDPPF
ncbi:MAG: hypothetical protein ACRERX_04700 [Pseudomonas sp.]